MLKALKEHLLKCKFKVKVEDLTKQNFNMTGGYGDFKEPKNPTKLDYIDEQKNALEQDNWSYELIPYIDNIKWCDYVIHLFPLYRFSVPAIHKGWLDRVMGYNNLTGKKWMICTTVGQPKAQFSKDGLWGMSLEDLLIHVNISCARFLLMETLPMFALYDSNNLNQKEREQAIVDLVDHVKKHVI